MLKEEFCRLYEEIEKFSKLAADEVSKINKKGDLTPGEVDSVYKISNIMEKSTKAASMLGLMEGEEYDYSRGYSGYMPYPSEYSMRGNSYARGRSATTGRYVSRDYGMSRNMGGHSGHSIDDRMIMALEQQMDAAQTDYERQRVQELINQIRMGEMR